MNILNRKTADLPATRPNKILQFGGGNFLRAFTDWMIDELNKVTDFDAGVIIVKPTERGDYTALREQDGLFHIVTKGIRDGELVEEHQLIECVQEVIHPYLEWDKYLRSAESPFIRFIISNTTESGIKFNEADKFSDSPPIEFPGKLTRWLYHRWKHFRGSADSGCVMLPCELIEANGDALKACVLKYIEFWELGGDFLDWLDKENHFCNTLVDRIVPGFPKDIIEEVYNKIGFEDVLVVAAEPYHTWVIEASSAIQSQLPFDQTNLNVVFTDDLSPFTQLKIRILNGAHTAMVPVGYLANIESVREAIEDEKVGSFVKQIIFEEILPILDLPQDQKEKYANDVLDRFRNPFIHHQLISISLNSTSKFRTRVLPSLLVYIEKYNEVPNNLVTAFAALICFYSGKRGDQDIPLKDSKVALSFFRDAWARWTTTKDTSRLVQTVLSHSDLWGVDLYGVNGLSDAVVIAIEKQVASLTL